MHLLVQALLFLHGRPSSVSTHQFAGTPSQFPCMRHSFQEGTCVNGCLYNALLVLAAWPQALQYRIPMVSGSHATHCLMHKGDSTYTVVMPCAQASLWRIAQTGQTSLVSELLDLPGEAFKSVTEYLPALKAGRLQPG